MISRTSKTIKRLKPKWASFAQKVAKLIDSSTSTALARNTAESIGVVAEIGRTTLRPFENEKLMDPNDSMEQSKSEIISILARIGCPDLTNRLDTSQCTDLPIAGGGLGDVYKGRLDSGAVVAIKCARPHTIATDMDYMQNTTHEIYIWSKCKHENVLELFGLAQFNSQIAIVSPWMENGILPDYIQENLSVDRCKLCEQVATGLAYLHGAGVVHGDIKGSNVLISDTGIAKLADFGNACLTEYAITFSRLPLYTQSLRWSAPEICVQETTYTREGDVYALGMTILEIITGQVPRSHIRNDMRIMFVVVVNKEIPSRPIDHIPIQSLHGNILWSLLEGCWATNPIDRPKASAVKAKLELVSRDGLIDRETPSSERAAMFARLVGHGCTDLTMVLNHDHIPDLIFPDEEPSSFKGVLVDGTKVFLRYIKRYRDPPFPPSGSTLKSSAEDLCLWSTCEHTSILPLLGVAIKRKDIVTVHPRIKTRKLNEYLLDHADTNRCHMCLELSRGVEYLHNQGLNGMGAVDIEVSDDGTIKLIPCRNVVLYKDQLRFIPSRDDPRWEAPNLDSAVGIYDVKSDVYALGMTLFDIVTDEAALSCFRTRSKPLNEQLPTRPHQYIPSGSRHGDQFWTLLNRCWASNPQDRPKTSVVVEVMEVIDDIGLYGRPSDDVGFTSSSMSIFGIVQNITGHVCSLLRLSRVGEYPIDGGSNFIVYQVQAADHVALAAATPTYKLAFLNTKTEIAHHLTRTIYNWSKCSHDNILELK